MFPKQALPVIILNTGVLNDKCFRELDKSNNLLKKYDPITYYKLEGLGKTLNSLRKQQIMPFLMTPNLNKDIVIGGTENLLNETLQDIEDNLEMVAEQINKKTTKRIKKFIDDYLNKDNNELLEEIDLRYYEMITQLLPKEIEKPSFDEFKESSGSEEFQKMQEIQMQILIDSSLEQALGVLANNPGISGEYLLNEIKKEKNQKVKP